MRKTVLLVKPDSRKGRSVEWLSFYIPSLSLSRSPASILLLLLLANYFQPLAYLHQSLSLSLSCVFFFPLFFFSLRVWLPSRNNKYSEMRWEGGDRERPREVVHRAESLCEKRDRRKRSQSERRRKKKEIE